MWYGGLCRFGFSGERMRRIRLTVAYDGTNYCGWQVQPNVISVQQALEDALAGLFGREVRVTGASRTDAGVHALGNVAVFDLTERMPASRIAFALNTYLPADIRVQKSEEVDPSFHPRFCRTEKTYEYRILNRQMPDPTRRLYAAFWHYPLDERRMQQAGDFLVGTHDFSAFSTAKAEVTDRVRTITELTVCRSGDEIRITVRGNGFLYNMVRIIAGTLIRVGGGQMEPEEIPAILASKDRARAGETARPEGLTLVGIRYLDEEHLAQESR